MDERERLTYVKDQLESLSREGRMTMKVIPLSFNDNQLICEMKVEEEDVNERGILHGGLIATLTHVITSRTISALTQITTGASVELSISHLLSISVNERMTMASRVLQIGDRMAFGEIDFIREDGRMAAKGRHTMVMTHK